MKLLSTPSEMKDQRQEWSSGRSVGFVPTMGGLHSGHIHLIERAQRENDICVVSIFLNPTQFDSSSDLKTYPANFSEDRKILHELGVDVLFAPISKDMYPDNYNFQIQEKTLSQNLCGKSRPGHFDGVLTVVAKLLNIIQPNRAYFGEKDHQQLELISGMVKALFMDVEVVPVPTVRDAQGLALSSRNKKLTPTGLERAHLFARTLQQKISLEEIERKLKNNKIEVDYLEEHGDRRYGAVNIDDVRLIDNVEI